jgi:hypothetical protein
VSGPWGGRLHEVFRHRGTDGDRARAGERPLRLRPSGRALRGPAVRRVAVQAPRSGPALRARGRRGAARWRSCSRPWRRAGSPGLVPLGPGGQQPDPRPLPGHDIRRPPPVGADRGGRLVDFAATAQRLPRRCRGLLLPDPPGRRRAGGGNRGAGPNATSGWCDPGRLPCRGTCAAPGDVVRRGGGCRLSLPPDRAHGRAAGVTRASTSRRRSSEDRIRKRPPPGAPTSWPAARAGGSRLEG